MRMKTTGAAGPNWFDQQLDTIAIFDRGVQGTFEVIGRTGNGHARVIARPDGSRPIGLGNAVGRYGRSELFVPLFVDDIVIDAYHNRDGTITIKISRVVELPEIGPGNGQLERLEEFKWTNWRKGPKSLVIPVNCAMINASDFKGKFYAVSGGTLKQFGSKAEEFKRKPAKDLLRKEVLPKKIGNTATEPVQQVQTPAPSAIPPVRPSCQRVIPNYSEDRYIGLGYGSG